MSYFSIRCRVAENFLERVAGIGVCFMVLSALACVPGRAQSADTVVSLSTETPVHIEKPVEKQTKIFQIKYSTAGDIQNITQAFITPTTGRMTRDDRTNILIVVDSPDVIKKIEDLIASVDIPLETLIVPIKYADVQDVARILMNSNPRLKVNIDLRTNSIIITDIPSKVAQTKTLVDQIESTLINKQQMGLDCSIVKVTLDDKHNTGIDWGKCPFAVKDDSSSSILLDNMDPEKLLEWLGKFGSVELLSRKRVTITPNEETIVREGFRFQAVDKSSMSTDTLGGVTYKMIPRGEDSGFTYRFIAKPGDTKSNKSLMILSFSVDGVLPQRGSTSAYGISVSKAQIPNGMTMVTEDIRGIPVAQETDNNKTQYNNVDLILLITPHSLKAETPGAN